MLINIQIRTKISSFASVNDHKEFGLHFRNTMPNKLQKCMVTLHSLAKFNT